MLWMKNFCFCCSVRLGVIVSVAFTMIQLLILMLIFMTTGTKTIQSFASIMEDDEEYSKVAIVKSVLEMISNRPQDFVTMIELFATSEVVACGLAIYGAYKLKKWYLVPYMILEIFRFTILMALHIITMIILKKTINLGILIAATITGGFILLYIGYAWTGVIAFFQIIQLVNTPKYKTLYGDDPFAPWNNNEDQDQFVENIKMYPTPNYDDIPAKKAWGKLAMKVKENNVATIRIDEPDINLAVRELQNWHVKELFGGRRTNLVRYY